MQYQNQLFVQLLQKNLNKKSNNNKLNTINMKKLTFFLSSFCIFAIIGIIIACTPSQSKEKSSKNLQKITTNENNSSHRYY